MPETTLLAPRMRATRQHGHVVVRALMFHDEDTGLTRDEVTGQLIPAHFIQRVLCTVNGKPVLRCLWGIAISKNPFLEFHLRQARAGDVVALEWFDNEGMHQRVSTTVP
jgi:sulfur-oxidizing protein SoxZ